MVIEEGDNKFVYFNLDGGKDDSLELDFYIIRINGTNGPIYKKFNTFRFKNN
jgi:hypothetical protein